MNIQDDDFPFQAAFVSEMKRVREAFDWRVGDIYEDCSSHPVLCVRVSYEEDDLQGISLIDGSYPRSCSMRHCGVRKLTVAEAWAIRTTWHRREAP